MTSLALPLTAIVLLGASPVAIGVLTAAGFIPYLVLGLPAGVLVDRYPPVPLLVCGDLGRAVLLGSIPVAAVTGHLTLAQLYFVALAVGSLTVVFGVAHQSTIHSAVDRSDLIDANAKTELSVSGAQIGGPGLGGFLIGALGAPVAIGADAFTFVLSAVFLAGLRVPSRRRLEPRTPNGGESLVAQIREGIEYIIGNPVLRALALNLALINLFFNMFDVVLLVYLVRRLHLHPSAIGLVLAAAGAGSLVGAALTTRIGHRIGVGRLILLGSVPVGAVLIPLAPTANPLPLLLVGNFITSAMAIGNFVTQRGLRQAITPPRLQGRMTATMRTLIFAPVPLGSLIGGALGSIIGLRQTLFVGAFGVLLAVVPIIFSTIPGIRVIPEAPPEAAVAPPFLASLPVPDA